MRVSCLVLTLALLPALSAAAGEKCPKGTDPIFAEDLQAIPDCVAAHRLHDACAWASSGDSGLTGVVVPKCEARFLGAMSQAQKRLYEQRGNRCDAAYPHDTSSMQIFQASMCREELAVTYFKAAAPGPIVRTPPWKGPAPPEE